MLSVAIPVSLPQAPAAEPSWIQWLWEATQTRGTLETLVAILVAMVCLIVWWRLSRLGDRIKNRSLLSDYFFGIEQALQGDLSGAEERLERVLAEDPENHYARMLLGNVYLLLKRPEKAHAQHLLLRDSFAVGGASNSLQLGMALLAAGRPREAAEAALSIGDGKTPSRDALEFAFRARLQAGDPIAAAEIASRILPLLARGENDAKLRRRESDGQLRSSIAIAFAQAGSARLTGGDRQGAAAFLQRATALGRGSSHVALLQARLDAVGQLPAVAAQRLLGCDTEALATTQTAAGSAVPERAHNWPQRLAHLWPEGRWRCSACGTSLLTEAGPCTRCGAEDKAKADEPLLFMPVQAPDRLADALEANAAHVRRACRQALEAEADSDDFHSARRAVLELGEQAVPELLDRATGRGQAATAAIDLLRDLGPKCTPALFAAAERREERRIFPDGGATANAVGRVVQGYGREALPHMRALFASAKSGSRKVLIDYFLGLADMTEFQAILERFPPVEILNRIAKADEAVLRRFLQAIQKGSFVADVLLADPMFERDVDVFRAIPGAAHPDALEGLLARRGPSRALLAEWIEVLAEEPVDGLASRQLVAAGVLAVDVLIAALVDEDRSESVRQRMSDLVARIGPACVDRLCDSFASEPSDGDDFLRATLVRMGDPAVEAICAAYTRPGLIGLMTIGYFGRGGHRRRQLVLTLRQLGTNRCRVALASLRAHELDADMQLAMEEALHHLGRKSAGGEDVR